MDLTPNHKLKNLISIERTAPERTVTFPEILQDEHHNYLGIVTLDGRSIEDPMLAFSLSLVKWGYDNLDSFGTLKVPYTQKPLNLPSTNGLSSEIKRNMQSPRDLKEFFAFRKELPLGVANTTANWEKKARLSAVRFSLPTLSVGKRGYRAVEGMTAYEAAFISAIQAGYKLRIYDNPLDNLEVDDSALRVAFLKGRMSAPDFPQVITDSGWKSSVTSRPSYGLHDYERQITLSYSLDAEKMKLFQEYLDLDHCPGYTGISAQQETGASLGPTAYTFRTTCDSSG